MTDKHKSSHSKKLMLIADMALVIVSFIVGATLRDPVVQMIGIVVPPKEVLNEMWWMLVVASLIMPFLLSNFNHYSVDLRRSLFRSMWVLLRCSVILGCIIAGLIIFFKLDPSSRLAIILSFSIMVICLFIRDRVWRRYCRALAKNSKYREMVIVAGVKGGLDDFISSLPEDTADYWEIMAKFDFSSQEVSELRDMLDRYSIQKVVFNVEHTEFKKLSEAIEICETQGVEAWVHAGFIRTQVARPDFDSIGDKPMLVLRTTPELSWELFFKEVLDRVGSAILIVLALPFLLFAYVGIRITSPGHSPFFVQDRSGKFGRPFKMYKLRTMVPDAEAKLSAVKEEAGNQMDGPVFKLDKDPRVFKFGSFLRKTSIDELPQLLNVLLGDMSLVGPRPLPVYEVKEFEEAKQRRRLSMKPGITCTWQAGGRNSITSFEEWVEMDLAYIDTWSLRKDIIILLKTVPAVLFSKGAK